MGKGNLKAAKFDVADFSDEKIVEALAHAIAEEAREMLIGDTDFDDVSEDSTDSEILSNYIGDGGFSDFLRESADPIRSLGPVLLGLGLERYSRTGRHAAESAKHESALRARLHKVAVEWEDWSDDAPSTIESIVADGYASLEK